ncbi:MAG: Gfo/Idh/MocA family oxidoreductase [Bryobacteraceae bacterium]|nr:Gfo/Idh/MocA family oxidoreductase [Bryobacteraceae bacterium]
MQVQRGVSRRALLSAAAAFPSARRVLGANDRIRIGVIGAGNRSGLLIDQLPKEAEIVSVADCFLERAEQAKAKRQARWRIHQDYRKLLDEKDVDAVIVGTTDHARVLACIHACEAGKDVYAEKPLTLYVAEGRALVNAVRRYNRILQVGSQQRSMAMNQVACDFVRKGGLGRLYFVQGVNYGSAPKTESPAAEPAPEGMNWDMWVNQASMRPYSKPLYTGWMAWRDYSGGQMTNWGAHGLDQIQSALGMDETGPVEFWPLRDGPAGALAFRYANGATVRLEMPEKGRLLGGAIFAGENGRIEIYRNGLACDPPELITELPDKEEVVKWDRAQWQAEFHMHDWLQCARSRRRPLAEVEVGHRSVSLAHLANITRQLNRGLRWDPAAERFVDDDEANGLLRRPRRKGYELPRLSS